MRAELVVDIIILALGKEVHVIVGYLTVKCIAVCGRNGGSVIILRCYAIFLVLEFLLREIYAVEAVSKLL